MRIRLSELRRIIRSVILEGMPTRDDVEKAVKDANKKDSPSYIKGGTQRDLSRNADRAFQDEIEDLRYRVGYEDVDAFIEHKLEQEEDTFSAAELQAISRNVESKRLGREVDVSSENTVKLTKAEILVKSKNKLKELNEMSPETDEEFDEILNKIQFLQNNETFLTFMPRPIEKAVRGVSSNIHGKHPFAGSGSGGSGMNRGVTRMGGGPGAIGGSGRVWKKGDPTSLP